MNAQLKKSLFGINIGNTGNIGNSDLERKKNENHADLCFCSIGFFFESGCL